MCQLIHSSNPSVDAVPRPDRALPALSVNNEPGAERSEAARHALSLLPSNPTPVSEAWGAFYALGRTEVDAALVSGSSPGNSRREPEKSRSQEWMPPLPRVHRGLWL